MGEAANHLRDIRAFAFARLAEVELIAKKNRGKEGRLAPATKIELISKKNRGKEGRLAPAIQLRPSYDAD